MYPLPFRLVRSERGYTRLVGAGTNSGVNAALSQPPAHETGTVSGMMLVVAVAPAGGRGSWSRECSMYSSQVQLAGSGVSHMLIASLRYFQGTSRRGRESREENPRAGEGRRPGGRLLAAVSRPGRASVKRVQVLERGVLHAYRGIPGFRVALRDASREGRPGCRLELVKPGRAG